MPNYTPNANERSAFLWLQGRVVELLLQHDKGRFSTLFQKQSGSDATSGYPEVYRELAALYFLRTELFDSILPRIKSRLSSSSPHELRREALPTRGREDWARTAAANWRERPGETPLEVFTHQRNRDFATPENLLTVLTILEYQETARRIIKSQTAGQIRAEQHSFNEIVEKCNRELEFLQFAGLKQAAKNILDGYGQTGVAELEQQTRAGLIPGSNTGYSDLLRWRTELKSLKLFDRSAGNLPALGTDAENENRLYQTWLFYELCRFLEGAGRLLESDYRNLRLKFRHGETVYALQHSLTTDEASPAWVNADSADRPDFYIWRSDPAPKTVEYAGQIIWHEPGFVLDAKYYRPKAHPNAADPLKQLLATMQLAGERYGAFLYAFEKEPAKKVASTQPEAASGRTIQPRPELFAQPDIQLDSWQIEPKTGPEAAQLWEQILDKVHAQLGQPVEIKCHGIFLDNLSANAHNSAPQPAPLLARNGATYTDDELTDLLLCPKPHVAPSRVDVVSRQKDCYKTAADGTVSGSVLCHILNQPGLSTPYRITNLQQIQQIASISDDPDAADEAVRLATQAALDTAQRYVDLLKPDLNIYRAQLIGKLDILDSEFDATPILTDQQKDTLVLATFLLDQTRKVKGESYAGPAIIYAGVLEQLASQTFFANCSDSAVVRLQSSDKTLGKIKKYTQHFIHDYLPSRWKVQVSPTQRYNLNKWIEKVTELSWLRNAAAHTGILPEADYKKFETLYFGGASAGGYGLLNAFIKAWKP